MLCDADRVWATQLRGMYLHCEQHQIRVIRRGVAPTGFTPGDGDAVQGDMLGELVR